MSDRRLRVDEHYDVLSSVEVLALIAPTLKTNPRGWKWMILAAQNAVQRALVCAIQDSTGTSVLRTDSASEVLNWLDAPTEEFPKEYLASFGTLLKKYRKAYPNSIEPGLHCKIRKLHNVYRNVYRNNFAHFVPHSWSIETELIPPLIAAALECIEIAMQQHQVTIRTNGNFKRSLSENLAAISRMMSA